MRCSSIYFSTLVLYSGYRQVEMDQQDIGKTAFVPRQGLFRFMVMLMLFRLCNAPGMFERLMELVLKDLIWKVCLIYLDDIIMYGAGFYPVLDRLKMVWTRIREANLKLKPTKCCLMRPKSRSWDTLSAIEEWVWMQPKTKLWRNGLPRPM